MHFQFACYRGNNFGQKRQHDFHKIYINKPFTNISYLEYVMRISMKGDQNSDFGQTLISECFIIPNRSFQK